MPAPYQHGAQQLAVARQLERKHRQLLQAKTATAQQTADMQHPTQCGLQV